MAKKKTSGSKRKVKCYATGEYGLPNEFIKRDGRWWKDEETYDKFQINLMYYHKIKNILAEIMGYVPGQVYPTVVNKKLKELEFYGYECIYKTFVIHEKELVYWANHKEFDTDFGRVCYVFAIIKNNINDVYRNMQKARRQQEISEKKTYDAPDEFDAEIIAAPHETRDISKWLEDDE